MVIFGLITRNMSSWTRDTFNPVWANYAETITLLVILVRGSLELEFKGSLIRIGILASIPHIIETICNFLLMFIALDEPVFISISFALSMTAVAPAVVVPLMIAIVKEGYGVKKLIPIKVIASSTIENVAVLVLFGIFSSLALN